MLSKLQQQLTPITFLLLLILVIYTSFFIVYGLQQHAAFQTAGFDLGIYDQVMWNTLHGNPMAMTTRLNVISRWGVHFEPILFLLMPFYAIYSSPQTLLVLQVIIVVSGAMPIFLLAQQKFFSSFAGFIFAMVYLLFPALQAALVFDFHAVALTATFFSWALWFLDNKKYKLMFAMMVLAMACKEDVSLLVFFFGGYVWLIHRQRGWGTFMMLSALFLFTVVNFFVIPSHSATGENVQLGRYAQWGQNLPEMISNLLQNPFQPLAFIFSGDRLLYWIRMTMPVLFLSFLDPLIFVIGLPTMVINTLSSYPPSYQLDRFHYSIVLVPFIVVAAINGLARLIKFLAPKFKHVKPVFLQNVLLVTIFLVTLIYQAQFGHTPIGRYFNWPRVTEHHRIAEKMLAQIPPHASVAAENNLTPHLSGREWIFVLPKKEQQGVQSEYLALDMKGNLDLYRTIENYCTQLDEFLTDPAYGLIFAEDGLLLFKRGVPNTVTFKTQHPCP